jgi:hypothetical protein
MQCLLAGKLRNTGVMPLILILIPFQFYFAGFDLRNQGTWYWPPSQMKNYNDISIGMSLNNVEKILGKKGTRQSKYDLPLVSNGHGGVKPNVEGKEFYLWEFKGGSYPGMDQRIWIGVSDGRVVSKDYYYPAF